MSEDDNQVPSALVAVATKALTVRSAALIRRGLALAKSLQPGDAAAHYNLGVALSNKGDLDGAIAEWREALRLNPNYGDAHYNLGVALWHKGDWDGAIA
jgi:tetratricopeptide (TPR) repeat protein